MVSNHELVMMAHVQYIYKTLIVSIVHQISLAKLNLYEIASKYNCEYCSAKFATVLSTSERC